MAVPDFQTLMLPVLRLIASGHETIPRCLPSLIDEFSISPEEAGALLPSGKQTVLANRAHWARNYMSQAGLVRPIRRGHYELTNEGRALLATQPKRIDKETLLGFPQFREWISRSNLRIDQPEPLPGGPHAAISVDETTPEARIEEAHELLNNALADELLSLMQEMDPVRFEQLILDLLGAMGYGSGDVGKRMTTKATGDGGIDGIIHGDALGLDAVYIQAKRYAAENRISRPAIQQFVGSLTGEGATKGVFVTTSDFSGEARAYLTKVQHRIVLINGRELARMMILHGVGVRARRVYAVKSVDEDYFADPAGL
ncbi:MAG: restriction endonuclease [Rhodobacteraceae bacterium]|nr:restriction endonuclease [Paracoccaceae bacterium]